MKKRKLDQYNRKSYGRGMKINGQICRYVDIQRDKEIDMGIRDSERGVKGKVKGEKRIVKNKGREERNPKQN